MRTSPSTWASPLWRLRLTRWTALEADFNRVNDLLCAQIPGILDVVEQLSPELRWTRWLIPDEVRVLQRVLTKLRGWLGHLPLPDDAADERGGEAVHQAAFTAALSSWYLQPTARLTPFPILIRTVAKRESRRRCRQHPGAGRNLE